MTRPDKIETEEDAVLFFRHLLDEMGLWFHPDHRFEDYVDMATGEPAFGPDEADSLNNLMDQVFEVLGPRIYDVALEEFVKEL